MKKLQEIVHYHRFEFFLISLSLILFGSLIFNIKIFDEYLFPIFLLSTIITGINLILKKKVRYFVITLFILATLLFGTSIINAGREEFNYLRFGLYFIFYIVITLEIIGQIWHAKTVNKNVIIGVISGYICLGMVGFFIFLAIEMANPGSYEGVLMMQKSIEQKIDSLLYYSFITLMTIGYGEIIPVTPIAQKSAILLGLLGQFYMVIITAVVVGKYIQQNAKEANS